MHDIASSRP